MNNDDTIPPPPAEPSNRPVLLEDARKKAEKFHAQSILDMFAQDPDLLKDAIIISPGIDSVIYPPGMSDYEVVGSLEAAKLTVLLGDDSEDEEDEEDEDDQ